MELRVVRKVKKSMAVLLSAVALQACSPQNQVFEKSVEKIENDAGGSVSLSTGAAGILLAQGTAEFEAGRYRDAMITLVQAAELGEARASRYIGLMYLNGYGVAHNAQRAAAALSQAAEAGDAPAQYWLAYCHEYGIGVPQRLDESLKWYTLAAQGKADSAADAMTAIGRLTEQESQIEAAEWYQRAAASGNVEAKEALERVGIKVSY